MIYASGLTKKFKDVAAVDSLNFTIDKGEIFGIVGPDGAGKSTLLRLLSTILRPDSGSIEMKGVDIFKNSSKIKESIAYMPQRFGLYEDLTVEENIYFFGRLYGISAKQFKERLKKLYGFSRLGPYHDRLAGKLSGGMKQKLGLACALVHTPELILLDEPTNGVDPVSRREFWKILYDLLTEGVTIIVSTAYLDEAERCNRIALMHEGKFIRMGGPKEIRAGLSKNMISIITDDPIKAGRILQNSKEFKDIFRSGTALKLFVDGVSGSKKLARDILQKNNIKIISIDTEVPSLEDSFLQIVSSSKEKP